MFVSGPFLFAGIFGLSANRASDLQRDVSSASQDLTSTGYALIADIDLPPESDSFMGQQSWQVRARSSGDSPLFIGLASAEDAKLYLSTVAHDRVTNFGSSSNSDSAEYISKAGEPGQSPGLPDEESFWIAKQEGTGSQTLQWHPLGGSLTVVLMNADGSAPVNLSADFTIYDPYLSVFSLGLTIGGGVLLAAGVFLVVFGALKRRRSEPPSGYAGSQLLLSGQFPHGQQPLGGPRRDH
jgi:hypothetical protein